LDNEEGMMWRDIGTAPKDRPLLGYADGVMAVVEWHEWQVGKGYWNLTETGSFAEDGEWNPTHWMPLPEPPK